MIIESYDVQTSSQRTFVSAQSTTMRATREIREAPESVSVPAAGREAEDSVSISDRFKDMHKKMKDSSLRRLAEGAQASEINKTGTKIPSSPEELKMRLIELMLEMMTGKKSSIKPLKQDGNAEARNTLDLSGFGGGNPVRAQIVDGWNLEHFQYESERVSYQAQGVVRTADGRTINVDINMFMSRQFVSYMNINIEVSRPVDPLVINYGGTAASLLGERFQFDLTMDGTMDNLAVLSEGSGFLAIDWEGNGIIKDGSQLFGPSSGCGFSELRKHDTDGNGWIDANDEIFSKLVVWSRDADGNDKVFTLKELGIGAIFLGDIETEFSFKDESNQTLGIMRSTSFFLKECGSGGTVSHIDLMV